MSMPMFHRVERRARRMHDMMERLGVDPGKLVRLQGGDAYSEARLRCLRCAAGDECLRWLAAPTSAESLPEFCPNLTLFRTCARN